MMRYTLKAGRAVVVMSTSASPRLLWGDWNYPGSTEFWGLLSRSPVLIRTGSGTIDDRGNPVMEVHIPERGKEEVAMRAIRNQHGPWTEKQVNVLGFWIEKRAGGWTTGIRDSAFYKSKKAAIEGARETFWAKFSAWRDAQLAATNAALKEAPDAR